jgi:hypothetical protein
MLHIRISNVDSKTKSQPPIKISRLSLLFPKVQTKIELLETIVLLYHPILHDEKTTVQDLDELMIPFDLRKGKLKANTH